MSISFFFSWFSTNLVAQKNKICQWWWLLVVRHHYQIIEQTLYPPYKWPLDMIFDDGDDDWMLNNEKTNIFFLLFETFFSNIVRPCQSIINIPWLFIFFSIDMCVECFFFCFFLSILMTFSIILSLSTTTTFIHSFIKIISTNSVFFFGVNHKCYSIKMMWFLVANYN